MVNFWIMGDFGKGCFLTCKCGCWPKYWNSIFTSCLSGLVIRMALDLQNHFGHLWFMAHKHFIDHQYFMGLGWIWATFPWPFKIDISYEGMLLKLLQHALIHCYILNIMYTYITNKNNKQQIIDFLSTWVWTSVMWKHLNILMLTKNQFNGNSRANVAS